MSCSKSKKRSHSQAFRDEYSEMWPVLQRSRTSEVKAYCKICGTDFSIAHGGKDDCKRHVEGPRHVEKARAIAANQTLTDKFIAKSDDLSVIRAEALFASFLVEHNCPIAASDHAGALFRKMFPDSRIAAKYGSARTKTMAIIRSLADCTAQQVTEKMKKSKFSLSTDGSNSSDDKKIFPVLVNCFDETVGRVVPMLLSLPNLAVDATGENIFSLLDTELSKRSIPWSNCVAFCSDNAPVMVGRVKGVTKFIKEKNPSLIAIGCACHLVHNVAKSASKKLPLSFEDFFVSVYFYLQRSSKRNSAFKMCQALCGEEVRKILKYVPTRWLSLADVVSRFLEQWQPLKKFFQLECDNGGSQKAKEIRDFLVAPTTEAYLLFMDYVLPLFCRTNTALQRESPMIHKLHRELMNLFSEILSRLMKPSAVIAAENILCIEFHDHKLHKSRDELVVGSKARTYMSTDALCDSEKSQFYKSVRAFYVQACEYMQKNFPLQDNALKNAEVVDIQLRSECKFSSLNFFMTAFNYTDDQKDAVEMEFASFQIDKLCEEILSCQRIDTAWKCVSEIRDHNGKVKYENLAKVAFDILVVPHSNAACERVFSTVRKNMNEFRANMSITSLEALTIEKSRLAAAESSCHQQQFSSEVLIKAKKATYSSLNAKV